MSTSELLPFLYLTDLSDKTTARCTLIIVDLSTSYLEEQVILQVSHFNIIFSEAPMPFKDHSPVAVWFTPTLKHNQVDIFF